MGLSASHKKEALSWWKEFISSHNYGDWYLICSDTEYHIVDIHDLQLHRRAQIIRSNS